MRGGSVLKRVGLLAFGLVVGLVATEVVLQVAAVVAQRSVDAELPRTWLTGSVRVVTLGDSHTYGLYYPPEKAYPKRLEALWAEAAKTPKLEVLNLGIPGTNSSSLVGILPDIIDTLSPDVVMIMVGTNDYWTSPFEEEDGGASVTRLLKRNLKLYKLYRLVRHGSKQPEAELELDPNQTLAGGAANTIRVGDNAFEVKWSPLKEGETGAPKLRSNLTRMAEIARQGGVELVLLTYPSRVGFPNSASKATRDVAKATNTKLIDVAAKFAQVCRDAECTELMIKDDQHPKASGHELAARAVIEALPALLSQTTPAQ